MTALKRVKPKSSHHKENLFSYFFNSVSLCNDGCSLDGVIHDNHLVMSVSQIMMLCTWNLHGAVCQVRLDKTGRKKVHIGNKTKTCLLYLLQPLRGGGNDGKVEGGFTVGGAQRWEKRAMDHGRASVHCKMLRCLDATL